MINWDGRARAELIAMDERGDSISAMADYFETSEKAIHRARHRFGLTGRRRDYLALLEQTVRITGKNEATGFTAYKRLAYCVAGIASEAGEIAGEYKKVLRNDNGVLTDERRESILAEVGDVLWYAQAIVIALGSTMDGVIQKNHDKLIARQQQGLINER